MLEPSIDQPRTRGQQRWRQRLRHYVRYAATCGWRTPPRAAASAPRPRSRRRRPPPSRRKRGRTRCRRRRHAATAAAAAAAGRRLVIYSKIPCPLRLSPNPFSIAFLLLVIFSSDVWPHYVACAPPPHLRHHSNRVRTDSPDDGHHKAGHRDLSSQPYQYRDHQPPQQQQLHLQLPVQPQRAHRSRDHRHSQYHGGGGGGGVGGDDDDDSRVSRSPQFHYDIGVTFLNQPSPHSKSQSQSQSHPHPGSSRPPCGPGIWGTCGPQYSRTHSLKRFGRSSYRTRQNAIEPMLPPPPPPPSSLRTSSPRTSFPPFLRAPSWSSSSSSSLPPPYFAKPWSTSDELTGGPSTAAAAAVGGDAPFAPCSHVGDETNEVGARAFVADTVFEGRVRSKSAAKDAVGKYGVTFVVQRVYKDQTNGQTAALRPKTQVRLYFVEKASPANAAAKPTAHCVQRYNFTRRGGDLTKANVKRGRRYIVFVNRIGPHNYTILGEPVPHTRKNAKAVNEVLCRGCVRQVGVWGLKNETAFVGERLRLVCRVKGTPLPALQWFKDGSPIIVTSRLRIQYKKRRSLLVIPEVRNSDSGKYECRGLGVQSIGAVSSSSIVSITAKLDNITALWPLAGKPCPLDAAYCLNGGTCTYYETIGEFTCQCADGFNGGRCENKDVINSNSTYEPITCYDGVTPSYPCVTVHKPLDYSS